MNLLSVGNPKTLKGMKQGYNTYILHLAPASLSGHNVCPKATQGCIDSCLNTAGRGGDSAMEEANFLTRFAKKVVLIHRRDSLRASKIMVDRAKANPKIEFLWNTEVIDVLGEDKMTGLKLRNTVDGSESEKPFTGLFVAIGHLPRSELVKGQVDLDAEGYVKVDGRSTRTNLTGVFACGDLVDHTYRQAITAAGTGCEAALDAERFLAGH